MNTWRPIRIDELESLVETELGECSNELRKVFNQYRVPFHHAPLERYGLMEQVFIVAKRDDEVMYYEDVEEGFNFSPINSDGRILEHWCNQYELRDALIRWLSPSGADTRPRLAPTVPMQK